MTMGEENRVSVIYASQNKLPFGARRIGAKRDGKKRMKSKLKDELKQVSFHENAKMIFK